MATGAKKRIQTLNIKPLVERWRFFKMARPENYGGSYWKNACAEIPEVLLGSVFTFWGLGIMAYATYFNEREVDRTTNRPYRYHYTVIRPDDPRVSKIRMDHYNRKDGPDYQGKPFYPDILK